MEYKHVLKLSSYNKTWWLCLVCTSTPRFTNDVGYRMANKANLRDLIAATGLVILLKFDPNHRFFSPCDLETWWMTSKNRWIQTDVSVRKRLIRVKIGVFVLCDLKIWWMTLENNRAPLLYYIKLCASFQIHRRIETEVTVRKHSIRVKKSAIFLSC